LKLYLSAYTIGTRGTGIELWAGDGTAAGLPVLVADIRAGSGSSFSNSGYGVRLVYKGGKLYFAADDGVRGVELWSVDV